MDDTGLATIERSLANVRDESRMIGPRAVALRDLADVERFATLIYKSSLVPKEYRNNMADVVGVIAFGLEIGLNPMQALQNISWINSKPSVYGDMMLALIEASGLLEEFEETDPDEAMRAGTGRCLVKRRGRSQIVRTFTKADAELAKLWNKDGPWKQYPGRMLQMRARSWALRDAFSDVLKGLIAREEAQDILDVTPTGPRDSTLPLPPLTADEPPTAQHVEMKAFLLDEVMGTLKRVAPGNSTEDREKRIHLMREAFGVTGWSKLKGLTVTQLQAGYAHLQGLVTHGDDSGDDDVPLGEPPNGPAEPVADRSDVSEGTESHEGDHKPPSGLYANALQITRLKRLAEDVGPEAVADVHDMIEYRQERVPLEIWQTVMDRLQARKEHAPPPQVGVQNS